MATGRSRAAPSSPLARGTRCARQGRQRQLQRCGAARLEVVEADALDVTLPPAEPGDPLWVVGNLPYAITSPILFHVLDQVEQAHRELAVVLNEVSQVCPESCVEGGSAG